MKFLMVFKDFVEMERFAGLIRQCVGYPKPIFDVHVHADVFSEKLPWDVDAVLVEINDASDLEAARQLRKICAERPLIVVGSCADAALQAVELGAHYYLDQQARWEDVAEALWRCGL
jgi:DNA-binding NarL/FixJ family response regulator